MRIETGIAHKVLTSMSDSSKRRLSTVWSRIQDPVT